MKKGFRSVSLFTPCHHLPRMRPLSVWNQFVAAFSVSLPQQQNTSVRSDISDTEPPAILRPLHLENPAPFVVRTVMANPLFIQYNKLIYNIIDDILLPVSCNIRVKQIDFSQIKNLEEAHHESQT